MKSPCLDLLFRHVFTPYPLFQWYAQNNEILLNFSLKCWNSTFNVQGLSIIIIVVHVGVVKIHITIVDAFKKNERSDEI